MSLRLPAKGKPGAGLQATLVGLARRARRDAERIASDPERRTHAIRTGMKKFRALLRLAKPRIPPEERRALLRLIAKMKGELSGARDRVVIAAVAGKVLGKTVTPPCRESTPAGGSAALVDVAKELETLATALDFGGLGRGTLRKRWKHTRRRAEKAGKRARDSAAAEDFHRWRKRVKELWYQSDALAALSDTAAAVVKPAKTLSGILGREHDLTVAMETLDTLSKDDRATLEKQREKSRRKAFAAARNL